MKTTNDNQREEQKTILKVHLEDELKKSMPKIKKQHVDAILVFVGKYFGQDLHGLTDRAEFRKLIETLAEDMGEVD